MVTARPENGTAWAFKGLCEFRLKSYDTALSDLIEARTRGVVGGQSMTDVARYHSAILLTRIGEFDQALLILNDFGLEGNDSPGIIEAMGLAVLRLPMLPADLPGARRELVLMAGRARYFQSARMMAGAQSAFELLTSRYPDTPNVHYAYGVFLLAEQPEKAIGLFERELKVSPQSVYAKLQIAFAHIRRGEYEQALPWAKQAVDEAPTEFVARTALGQVLLETGDVARRHPRARGRREAGAGQPDHALHPGPRLPAGRPRRRRREGAAGVRAPQPPVAREPDRHRVGRRHSARRRARRANSIGHTDVSRSLLRLFRLVLLLAAGTTVAAQQPPAAQPPAQRASQGDGIGVTAIVVDVVVRDKQGNPITGLTASDFQIFGGRCPAGGRVAHRGQQAAGDAAGGSGLGDRCAR